MGPSNRGNRRVHRRPTSWEAQCRVANDVVMGAVLDISAHGAFFSPMANGTGELRIGQVVAIAFETDPNLAGLDLPCRVRWIGYSTEHRQFGFGVEFTSGPIAV